MSGPSNQTSTLTGTQTLAPFAQPVAKAALGSLLGYLYPGTTVPSNWFSTKGFSFPTGGPGTTDPGVQQAQQNIANSPLQSVLNDPVMNSLFSPMVSGSSYLQNLAGNDPSAIYGALSPAAAQQLGTQYGPQSMAGLNWIPYFNPGGATGTTGNPTASSWPYATGGQTAGSQQVG